MVWAYFATFAVFAFVVMLHGFLRRGQPSIWPGGLLIGLTVAGVINTGWLVGLLGPVVATITSWVTRPVARRLAVRIRRFQQLGVFAEARKTGESVDEARRKAEEVYPSRLNE